MPWPDRSSVLVPIDFSEASFDALGEALKMVRSPSDVYAVHVLPSLESEAEHFRAAFDSKGRASSAEKGLRARVAQVNDGVHSLIRIGIAGDEIAATAKELGCDLIVIPSHGRSGPSRLLLGSVAERVLRKAPCAVLVLRRDGA